VGGAEEVCGAGEAPKNKAIIRKGKTIMLKEALAYLVSLNSNKTYNINGETYSDHELIRIDPHINRAEKIAVNGLDSIVKLIKAEYKSVNRQKPLFVRAVSPRKVEVFSALDVVSHREYLYEAICDAPDFKAGWCSYEDFVIILRSAFIPNDGTEYLFDLLSRVSKNGSVSSDDNGIFQNVTVRQGISVGTPEQDKPRIPLIPYRTFSEIEQPESEFILRVNGKANIGLFEADGAMWKITAKKRICAYFETALKEEIAEGKIVVMM